MADPLPRGAVKLAADALRSLGVHPGDNGEIAKAALLAALPLIERAALKRAAEHIILLEELANGWRCPACHGKPASTPHLREGRTGYTCGCGHAWEPPKAGHPWSMQPERLVRLLARGQPLPDLPPKLEADHD